MNDAAPIDAVLIDLDDTCFPQHDWLSGAWTAVADAGQRFGVDPVAFRAALEVVAEQGSDRGRIIDRALDRIAATAPTGPLVEAFRTHAPSRLNPYGDVPAGLADVRQLVPVGLVTDGYPAIQRAKVKALGLDGAFDVIVFSDELGRQFRKPHPAPFRAALAALHVEPERCVYVGDRPDKDIDGAAAVGMRAIRVATGEYSGAPDGCAPWHRIADAGAALRFLEARIRRERRG